MLQYEDFLKTKAVVYKSSGLDIDDINPMLFPFQRDIVKWSLRKGRSAIFLDCGLGKTPIQLEFAKHVHEQTGGNVLIVAPLAVSAQTVREGEKFGVKVNMSKMGNLQPGINITNYERLHYFKPDDFSGIVLDESGILKAFSGKVRKQITEFGREIDYRLACTATPAPNDYIELSNHAEFLDVLTGKEIIALFFTQDGNSTTKWRLRKHGESKFWEWMASWAVAMRFPSDLGYEDDGFILPELKIHQMTTNGVVLDGQLLPMEAVTLAEQREAKRKSLTERVGITADLVNGNDEAWLVWCNLNAESSALAKAIPDAVEIQGSDKPEFKERAMLDFIEGKTRVLVTKPKIAGFGMNFQHCHNAAFVGLSHSYEQLYQAMRRIWRFGQIQPVNIYMIICENEGRIVANIERKERQAKEIMERIVSKMSVDSEVGQETIHQVATYVTAKESENNWEIQLGDSIKLIDDLPDESVGLTVTSPPFPGMYVYSNSVHDVGNVKDIDEMIEHFRYLVKADKLMRVTIPGRSVAIHLTQVTAMISREGYMGLHDFRGEVIRLMESEGWHWTGEACISKNPQIQATRNKEHQLLFKSLANDSSIMRPALPDWLLIFRKPGRNPFPIRAGISEKYDNPNGWITENEWINWADGIWWMDDILREQESLDLSSLVNVFSWPYYSLKMATGNIGIRETDVLNVKTARGKDDERHLCPLQLGVIARAVKLWSAPGETVFDPFMGIGSTGYEAIKLGRKFMGFELKESYYNTAIKFLREAERESHQIDIFDQLGEMYSE